MSVTLSSLRHFVNLTIGAPGWAPGSKHFLEARGEDQTDHTNGFACEVGKAVRHATR